MPWIKLYESLARNPFRRSLDLSWKEGIAASIMQAPVDEYLIPLGLFLGATPLEIGFLVAIPHLLGSFSQFFAVQMVDILGSRLRFLVRATTSQAFLLLPVAFFPFFVFPSRILALIGCVSLFRILANLIATVWGSLTSDYLRPEDRGKYFGWRSRITGFAGVTALAFGGVLLNASKKFSVAAGFCALFLVTALARAISAALTTSMQDIPYQKKSEDSFTFLMFLRRFRSSNFVKFVAYVAGITFATYLAAPYFSVYMLRDLKFSYLVYMFLTLANVVSGVLFFPLWGRHADVVGNASVLKVTSFLIPLIPLLWILSPNVGYLFCVQVFSGFAWSGFNLCALNFIFDAVSPGKRVRCLGYFSFINGMAIVTGAALGGYLAERISYLHGSRILALFFISGGLRLLCHFFLSPQFHEVRTTFRRVSSLELFFSVVGIKPLLERNQV